MFSTRRGRFLGRKFYTGARHANGTFLPLRHPTPDRKRRSKWGASAAVHWPPRRQNQSGKTPMAMLTETSVRESGMTKDEKFVIFASSLGTVFEWYDFYLYATLAPFFAALFFPPGNQTAALLSAFAAYAAGFLVRAFGALVFGRIGDLVGRKYTFLVPIVFMGGATFLVGLLPTYESIGWFAPILMVSLRLVQGLALGGEYGGAATYVAEHAPHNKRGYDTSWIQTTATLGLFLALLIIY